MLILNVAPTPPGSSTPVVHREAEYDSRGFEQLVRMQRGHFWYRGRHHFLAAGLRRHISPGKPLRAVDLGGGCGGWAAYLARHEPFAISELALADSSARALQLAAPWLPEGISTHQVDLMDLPWESRWDVAFLLDVIEHLPDDVGALRQVYRALAPGGLLVVSVPALPFFWSWNDEAIGHQRRYSVGDFVPLAHRSGFELLDARYFMFFLSPLVLAGRYLNRPKPGEDAWKAVERTHRIPAWPINTALSAAFLAETPLGHWLRFPWGTSAFAILRKPGGESPAL
jgi:SAM-dependent methyltransferase